MKLPASRNLERIELQSAPIPEAWVIAGHPQARAADMASSPDGTCTSAQWDCSAGTFYWYFGVEETIHILEGDVVVRDASGDQCRLRRGDVAVMPANQWMIWHVQHYVRKLALCRYPVPRPFGRAFRFLQGLRNRVTLRRPPSLRHSVPVTAAEGSQS
jgi:uncharacterized cupin superfamily protein